jgi:hypothetical protein
MEKMKGYKNQTTKQIGEFLVAAELARQNFLVTVPSGQVPVFDLLATDSKGRSIPLQVKSIRAGGGWQFQITQFARVTRQGKKQILGEKVKHDNVKCVFVVIREFGQDEFYILNWKKLSNIAIRSYQKFLDKHGGGRPNKQDSLHFVITPGQLSQFRNRW